MSFMKKVQDAFREDSAYKALFVSLIAIGLGYGIYKGVIDNYLAEIVSMTEFDRGVAEFFRELPGLFLVLILFYGADAMTISLLFAVSSVASIVIRKIPFVGKLIVG